MRELERKRAEAEGRAPRRDPDGADADDDGADGGDDRPAGQGEESSTPDADDDGDAGPAAADREPTPIRRRPGGPRSRRTTPPPPRSPGPTRAGGPDDGARPPWRVMLRRVGLGAVVVVIVSLLFLAGVGIDLWTDAIWYRSVGYDS